MSSVKIKKIRIKNTRLKILIVIEIILLLFTCAVLAFLIKSSDSSWLGVVGLPANTVVSQIPTASLMNKEALTPTSNINIQKAVSTLSTPDLITLTASGFQTNTLTLQATPTIIAPTFTTTILQAQDGIVSDLGAASQAQESFTPTPSLSLGIPTILDTKDNTLDSNNLNRNLPDGVLQEIAFFGQLGGGCGLRFCHCLEPSYHQPILFKEKEIVKLLESIGFEICGLTKSETITLTIKTPGEKFYKFETLSTAVDYRNNNTYTATFEFIPDLNDSLGIYELSFSGENWEIRENIQVVDRESPIIYTNLSQLILYKFQPNESVRIFLYHDLKFVGWKTYYVNQLGTLTINTDINTNYHLGFVAIGSVSGKIVQESKDGIEDWIYKLAFKPEIYCPRAPDSIGLTAFGYAEVISDSLVSYDIDGNLENLTRGTILQVNSPPTCQSNTWVWGFITIDGRNKSFSLPEANATQVFLRPLTQLSFPPTPDTNTPNCIGLKPTRLQVGMSAEVTTSGKAPQLSLRSEPSMSAIKVHVIAAGRNIVILNGPICAENSYWWYVRSEQGYEGWAREGDNEDYWIDPLP